MFDVLKDVQEENNTKIMKRILATGLACLLLVFPLEVNAISTSRYDDGIAVQEVSEILAELNELAAEAKLIANMNENEYGKVQHINKEIEGIKG